MNGHILGHSDYVTTGINATTTTASGFGWSGSATAAAWCDEYVSFCSEAMVYGCTPFSSCGNDTRCKKSQLALFRIDPTFINGRSSRFNWWLGSVASSANFVYVSNVGFANTASASAATGFRPFILFS